MKPANREGHIMKGLLHYCALKFDIESAGNAWPTKDFEEYYSILL